MLKTSNAIEILNKRIAGDPELQEMVTEAYLNAEVAEMIYKARKSAGLTQKQLANLIGTKQSVIARLEDADYTGHSLSMLQKIAAALHQKIDISFSPIAEISKPEPASYITKLGQWLHKKFDEAVVAGWGTFSDIGSPPALQTAGCRFQESIWIEAEKLAEIAPDDPSASIRRTKQIDSLGRPMALAVSIIPPKENSATMLVLLRLYSLINENLPEGITMTPLNEKGEPEYYEDRPAEKIQVCSDAKTQAIALSIECQVGESFSVEIQRQALRVCERFIAA